MEVETPTIALAVDDTKCRVARGAAYGDRLAAKIEVLVARSDVRPIRNLHNVARNRRVNSGLDRGIITRHMERGGYIQRNEHLTRRVGGLRIGNLQALQSV